MKILKKVLLSTAILGLFTLESMAGKQPKDQNTDTAFSRKTPSKKASSEVEGKKKKHNGLTSRHHGKKQASQKENVPPPANRAAKVLQKRKREADSQVTVEIEKKKIRLCPESDLKDRVQKLQRRMKEIHAEPERWEEIFKVYEEFKDLNYPKETWKAVAHSLKEEGFSICHFPNQSLKEAVGASIFYPSFIGEWIDDESRRHLLERFDIIWALTAGVRLKDARCQFYLGRGLDFIWENWVGAQDKKEKPEYIRQLFKKAFHSLPGCEENADVCYIMGRTYYKAPHKFFKDPLLSYDEEKALDLLEKGRDFKCQLQILEIKRKRNKDPISTIESYKNLGRQGYELAFVEAARWVDALEDQLAILKGGEEMSQGLVLLEMGYIYEEMIKTQQERKKEVDPVTRTKLRECYQKAGESGIAQGYIELGKSYVDDIACSWMYRRIKLETVSEGDIKKAKKAFKKAGKMKDYKGWEYLAKLNKELGDVIEKKQDALERDKSLGETDKEKQWNEYETQKQDYYKKGRKAGRKANTLGSLKCSWPAERKLKLREQEDEFIEKFGVIGALMKDIKEFLTNKH
ncbi:MAG: hypothetical protein BGO67_09630 [Alphaproteobacteria bacterium 41-28]|nr:MAG: hypothetical protein BGO67_09630 [Alphaproteobacteria bacterium 41-28]